MSYILTIRYSVFNIFACYSDALNILTEGDAYPQPPRFFTGYLIYHVIIYSKLLLQVAVLARACGTQPKKSIYEAMNKLLTKDVALKYNITGTAKK